MHATVPLPARFQTMSSEPPPALQHSDAATFACLRLALARPLAGDSVQVDGITGSIAETHGNRFVTVQPSDARAPAQLLLQRNMRITSPSGRSSSAVETRRVFQVLASDHEHYVDASGRMSVGGSRSTDRARMNQYHLLLVGCSDCIGAHARLIRLEVQAQGSDQVRMRRDCRSS